MPLPSESSPSPSLLPRRVVFATGIYPPEMGGPATYVRSMARVMHEKGWLPVVITYGDQQVPQDGWPVICVSRRGGALMRYFRYFLAVMRQAHFADVVYVQGGVSDGFPGALAAICAGKRHRIMMRVPGDYAWEMHQQKPGVKQELLDTFVLSRHPGSTGMLERMERWTAARARYIVAPSQYIKKIVTAWGADPKKIQVIYSAIPPLPVVRPMEEMRAEYGWQNKKVFFTVARAVPWKGVDFLINVFAELPESHVLCVAGDGPLLETWQQMAKTKGLGSRIQFLGRVDRAIVASWYYAADVFLLATGYEGFSHAVVEAVATGLPCVVSDRGGNPETLTLFPEHVRVCPYQDHEAWKTACLADVTRLPPAMAHDFTEGASRLMGLIDEVCVS